MLKPSILISRDISMPVRYDIQIYHKNRDFNVYNLKLKYNYQICLINDKNEAYLFTSYLTDSHITHYGPLMGNIEHILIETINDKTKINKIDVKYLDTNLTFKKPISSSLSSYITDNLYTSEKLDNVGNDPIKIKEDIDKYNDLKEQILYINFILTFVGSFILYGTNPTENIDETISFIYGGITGLLYQLLLQLDIDNIGKQEKINIILKLFANSAVRLTSIGILLTFYITYSNDNTSNLPLLLFGFWMHKLAVLLYFAKSQK